MAKVMQAHLPHNLSVFAMGDSGGDGERVMMTIKPSVANKIGLQRASTLHFDDWTKCMRAYERIHAHAQYLADRPTSAWIRKLVRYLLSNSKRND